MPHGITAAANGQTGFIYGYNLVTGLLSVCSVGPNGTPTFAFSYQWQGGLSNMIGFSMDGHAYLFGFRNSDRLAFILSADEQGNLSPYFQGQLDTQWTNFAIVDTRPYPPTAVIWAYQVGTGNYRMYAVGQNQVNPLVQGVFPAQYSMCVGFGTTVPTAIPYALAYNWQTNTYLITKLGGQVQATSQGAFGPWTSSSIAVVHGSPVHGAAFIWNYARDTYGLCSLSQVNLDGSGLVLTFSGYSGLLLFDNFAGFMANGNPYVVGFRQSDSLVSVLKINLDGTGFQSVYSSPISGQRQ
jgi:hypothetical protein